MEPQIRLWSSSHEDHTLTSAARTTWLCRLLIGAVLTTAPTVLCLLQLTTLLLALCAAAAILNYWCRDASYRNCSRTRS
jgi:hypothetical protein